MKTSTVIGSADVIKNGCENDNTHDEGVDKTASG